MVTRQAVSRGENGRGCPSIDSLKEISRYFTVSEVSFIVFDNESGTKQSAII